MAYHYDVHKVFASYFKGKEAMAYAISARLEQGHICLDIKEYIESPELTEINPFYEDAESFVGQSAEGEFVSHNEKTEMPFIVINGKAYLQRYFRYETKIRENIQRLGDHFKIITGGPGTGKTYGVAQELEKIFKKDPHSSVALAAPTGKAAARMNEALKEYAEEEDNRVAEDIREKFAALKAQTLHRMLGPKHDSVFFKFNKENKLPFDIIIVDECSMIDGAMMAKLLDAVDKKTWLYFLGDSDQLASVEAGSIFGDLCKLDKSPLLSGKVEVKTESYRFEPDQGIGLFSKEVIRGVFPSPDSFNTDEQITIDTGFSEKLFKEQALLYKEYIEEKEDVEAALKKLNRVRFLCVTRENEQSVSETNKKIEKILREAFKGTDHFHPNPGFYHNQPIIITKNDYSLGVFNGDVGLIRLDGDILYAYFEDAEQGIKRIQAGYLNHYDTVFAMTIHKSQGSEFNNVVVILPEKQGEKLLTRELLYTGVTRAKDYALVQATEETLKKCIDREVSRSSGLANQLTQT